MKSPRSTAMATLGAETCPGASCDSSSPAVTVPMGAARPFAGTPDSNNQKMKPKTPKFKFPSKEPIQNQLT